MLLKVAGAGHSAELTVADDATIGAIKLAVEGATGLAPGYQRLLCRGKALDDDEANAQSVGVLDRTKLMLMHSPAHARDAQALSAIDAIARDIAALEAAAERGSASVVEQCTQFCCKLDAVEVGESDSLRQLRRRLLARCDALSVKPS